MFFVDFDESTREGILGLHMMLGKIRMTGVRPNSRYDRFASRTAALALGMVSDINANIMLRIMVLVMAADITRFLRSWVLISVSPSVHVAKSELLLS